MTFFTKKQEQDLLWGKRNFFMFKKKQKKTKLFREKPQADFFIFFKKLSMIFFLTFFIKKQELDFMWGKRTFFIFLKNPKKNHR